MHPITACHQSRPRQLRLLTPDDTKVRHCAYVKLPFRAADPQRCRKMGRGLSSLSVTEQQQHQAASDMSGQVSALKTWLLGSKDVQQGQIRLEASAGLYSSVDDMRAIENVQAGEVGPSWVTAICRCGICSAGEMQCTRL